MDLYQLNDEQQIKSILKEFDFKKVHDIMITLNWKWYGHGVPSIKVIKEVAKDLLEDVKENIEDPVTYSATGGFKATRWYNSYSLEFIIESIET